MMGRGIQVQVSTAAWERDTLVITTVFIVPDGDSGQTMASEVMQTLSLRPSTSLVRLPSLVVETTISGVLGGPSSTTRTVYTKR